MNSPSENKDDVNISKNGQLVPEFIHDVILEWTQEGYLYMYDEQPQTMKLFDNYLSQQLTSICGSIYRRTDIMPVLKAKVGDIITLERVTSWSYNQQIPDEMYEGIESRLLVLEDVDVRGMDVTEISFFKEEEELILASCQLVSVKQDW